MSRGRVALQPAFVLHRRPYRESSLLVEGFTQEFGRVGVVARGALGGRGRRSALLQPFHPLLISWSGRGELLTLGEVESAGAPCRIEGQGVIAGLYLNELLMRLLPREDPHPELFAHYGHALATLGDDLFWALRRFEVALLDALGYGLLLTEGPEGGAIREEGVYDYLLDEGPREWSGGAPRGIPVHGATLLALAGEGGPDPQVLNESKRLLRHALANHLGPRPLMSRELWRQMSAESPKGAEGREGE